MNLNIHIGYHKTGTTSFQRHLSQRSNKNFQYIGRSYDRSELDQATVGLAQAVALDRPGEIDQFLAIIVRFCEQSSHDNFVLSHENFARPHETSFNGLRYLEERAREKFNLKWFLSTRDLPGLLVSRFLHDLGLHPRRQLYPAFLIRWLFMRAVKRSASCLYPYCKSVPEVPCACGKLKKISVEFYDPDLVKRQLEQEVTEVNLFCRDASPSSPESRLIFDEPDLFPLPHENSGGARASEELKKQLRALAAAKLERLGA